MRGEMANPEHVDLVKRGMETVEDWRARFPDQRLDLEGADLKKVNLIQAHLDGANFTRADLSGAMLKNASLKEANFTKAILVRANLTNAHLQGAKLQESGLQNAVLMRCDLTGADLSKSILYGTSFRGADLKDANFAGANLDGAVLGTVGGEFGTTVYKARNMKPEQIKQARNWEKAVYDDDFRKVLGLPPSRKF
jgi:uncharacterized protein YjbI with pentapeptide repeats